MSQRSSADVQIIGIGGKEVRPYLNRFTMAWNTRTEDDTKLGEAFIRFAETGVYHSALELAGTFDDGAGALHDALDSLDGATVPVLVGCSGNAVGRLMMGFQKYTQGSYKTEFAKGDFVKASAQAEGVGIADKVMRQLVILENKDKTFVLGSLLDESAIYPTGSVSGGVMHIQVFGLTLDGGTNVTFGIKTGTATVLAACTGLTPSPVFTASGALRIVIPAQALGTHMQLTVAWPGSPGSNTAIRFVAAWQRTPDPA